MTLRRDILEDEDRNLKVSIDYAVHSHAPLGRKLSRSLEELEEILSN